MCRYGDRSGGPHTGLHRECLAKLAGSLRMRMDAGIRDRCSQLSVFKASVEHQASIFAAGSAGAA